MHTWNAAAFARLEEIAQAEDLPSGWQGYQAYCRYRGLGLRKEALGALGEFVAEAGQWRAEDARDFCDWLLGCYLRSSNPQWLIPHPLMMGLVQPVLQDWRRDEPTAFLPAKWLGILNRDWDLLKEASGRDDDDGIPQGVLAELVLGEVEYLLHHVGEGVLLGSVADTVAAVERARLEVSAVQDVGLKQRLVEQLELNEAIVAAYREWASKPAGRRLNFPEWCRAKGHHFRFMKAYYYER